MKVALICPSNMLYMPYVSNYVKVLEKNNVNYTIINWDRFGIEEKSGYTFRDNKIGHQRNYYDYYKYKKYLLTLLRKENFDKIIIFTLQLGHFLKRFLLKNYKNRYIFDIRDYNKIIRFSNFETIIRYSYSTVISSPGFISWLPKSDRYYINHNTNADSLDVLIPVKEVFTGEKIKISTIGVIRHWKVNVDFVNSLKNNHKYVLIYHGEGTINKKLEEFIAKNQIKNVWIYGRYKKEEEGLIYKNTDMVSTLFCNDHINCKTLLSNRLYNSVIYGKPLIALSGNFVSEIIRKYNLGLVIDSFDKIEKNLNEYVRRFDEHEYNLGRISFFKSVLSENNDFTKRIEEFISF